MEENIMNMNNKNECDDEIADKLVEKCLDHFNDSMNNEIGRLWQRSIFLVALLVVFFAGYGNTLLKLIDSGCRCGCGFQINPRLNLLCIGIAFLGVLCSGFGIMMAKGSKAWQEKYEHTLFSFIHDMLKKKKALEDSKQDPGKTLKKLGRLAHHGFAHGYLKPLESEKFSNSFIKTKAGAYSASKINIAIGVISFGFWSIVGIVHSALVPPSFWGGVWSWISEVACSRFCTPLVFVVLSWSLCFAVSKWWCKSSVIQDAQDKQKAQNKSDQGTSASSEAKSEQDNSKAPVSESDKEQPESKPDESK